MIGIPSWQRRLVSNMGDNEIKHTVTMAEGAWNLERSLTAKWINRSGLRGKPRAMQDTCCAEQMVVSESVID